jgi:hypothetical protein
MAFVHCHGKGRNEKCDWGQDDFWSLSYNPVQFFFKNMFLQYLKPRMVGADPHFVGPSKLARFLGMVRVEEKPWVEVYGDKQSVPCPSEDGVYPRMVKEWSEHSWYILWRSFRHMVSTIWRMKWWTWSEYKYAHSIGEALCPKCGNDKLCID